MANILMKPFLTAQLPSLCFKRFRGKINIQRPRAPHYKRALVVAVTTPIYPAKERVRPCPQLKYNEFYKQEENPYERIIAREVKNWFDHSQMTSVFHINSISGEDFFKARVAFHKEGLHLKKFGNAIMNMALIDSKYEAIMPLLKIKTFSTGFVFSPDHKKVGTILKIAKKIPQFHLLCGIVDDRMLSKNEFTDYVKLPSIDNARSQLVNVLNTLQCQLVQNLSSHQSNLVNVLDAHARQGEVKGEDKGEVEANKPEPEAS